MNPQAKHTPGEWRVERTNFRHEIVAGNTWVAIVLHARESAQAPESREEQEANARLIAAAPELLEACKALIDELKRYEVVRPQAADAVRRAEEIVRKAGGAQ